MQGYNLDIKGKGEKQALVEEEWLMDGQEEDGQIMKRQPVSKLSYLHNLTTSLGLAEPSFVHKQGNV